MNLKNRWRAIYVVFKKAWPAWLAIMGIAISFWLGWLVSQNGSLAVSYAGTMLQVFGLINVAIGLSRTRRLFGQPSLRSRVSGWLQQLASVLRLRKPIAIEGSAAVSEVTAVAGSVTTGVGTLLPGASLEERVSFLERQLIAIRKKMITNKNEYQQEIKKVSEKMGRETAELRSNYLKLDELITEMAVGGIHLETVGLSWIILGVVATSIPDKIAALWCLVF